MTSEPLRTEPRQQLAKDEMLKNLVELLSPAIYHALHSGTRTCLTCDHFREHKGEVCGIANPPQRPPARIIAFGCPAYENEIPF
jgi:hypothetical protein